MYSFNGFLHSSRLYNMQLYSLEHFSCFFSANVIRMNSNFKIGIFKSLFKQIIDKPIYLGKENYNLMDYLNQVLVFSNSGVFFADCRFISCKGSSTSPITIANSVSKCQLVRCIFSYCSSQYGSGGAILSSALDNQLSSVCFSNCYANSINPLSWGGAGRFFGNNYKCSYVSCNKVTSRDGSFQIDSSVVSISNSNFSHCDTSQGCSGYQLSRANDYQSVHCCFYRNSCNSAFGFWVTGSKINIRYTNIVETSLFGSYPSVGFVRSEIAATIYVNNILIIRSSGHSIGGGPGPIVVFDSIIGNDITEFPAFYLNTYECKHYGTYPSKLRNFHLKTPFFIFSLIISILLL